MLRIYVQRVQASYFICKCQYFGIFLKWITHFTGRNNHPTSLGIYGTISIHYTHAHSISRLIFSVHAKPQTIIILVLHVYMLSKGPSDLKNIKVLVRSGLVYIPVFSQFHGRVGSITHA